MHIFIYNYIFVLNISQVKADNYQTSSPYWSNKKDGPTSIEEAKSKFGERKLDIIEGIWLDDHKWSVGTVAIYKKNNSYRMHIVEGYTDFNGTWEGTIFKKKILITIISEEFGILKMTDHILLKLKNLILKYRHQVIIFIQIMKV